MKMRRRANNWGSVHGVFASLKNPVGQIFHSTIERDLIYTLEADPWVVTYYAQPFTIELILEDGKPHKYTPDYLIIYRDDTKKLVECKPATRLDRKYTKQQIKIGQTWCQLHGYQFEVVTDADLRSGTYLANVKLLWRFARCPVTATLLESCIGYLAAYPNGVPLQFLAAHLAHVDPENTSDNPLQYSRYIYRLLFDHVIEADLHQRLTPRSLVRLPRQSGDKGED